MNSVEVHEELCHKLNDTYIQKNKCYGDSFHMSVEKYGRIAALTRMSDKWNRLENLILNPDISSNDESLEDTLMDLANYCLMTVMECDKAKNTYVHKLEEGEDVHDFCCDGMDNLVYGFRDWLYDQYDESDLKDRKRVDDTENVSYTDIYSNLIKAETEYNAIKQDSDEVGLKSMIECALKSIHKLATEFVRFLDIGHGFHLKEEDYTGFGDAAVSYLNVYGDYRLPDTADIYNIVMMFYEDMLRNGNYDKF